MGVALCYMKEEGNCACFSTKGQGREKGGKGKLDEKGRPCTVTDSPRSPVPQIFSKATKLISAVQVDLVRLGMIKALNFIPMLMDVGAKATRMEAGSG